MNTSVQKARFHKVGLVIWKKEGIGQGLTEMSRRCIPSSRASRPARATSPTSAASNAIYFYFIT